MDHLMTTLPPSLCCFVNGPVTNASIGSACMHHSGLVYRIRITNKILKFQESKYSAKVVEVSDSNRKYLNQRNSSGHLLF